MVSNHQSHEFIVNIFIFFIQYSLANERHVKVFEV